MPFDLIDPGAALERAKDEILSLNGLTRARGLYLSPVQARELAAARDEALMSAGRVEFGGGAIASLIEAFCDSPFLTRENYLETLERLLEIFYEYKNETLDRLSDERLISIMREAFDGPCQGSCELLAGRELYDLSRLIRLGPQEPEENEDERYDD